MEIQNQAQGSMNDLWSFIIPLKIWSSINEIMKLHSRLLDSQYGLMEPLHSILQLHKLVAPMEKNTS